MASGLHVHDISMQQGTMTATLGDVTGRHICLEVRPEDNEALDAAYTRLCDVIVAAASSVMLDLLDLHGGTVEASVPDTPDEPVTVEIPCRTCGATVIVPSFAPDQRGHVLRTTYCADHSGT